MMPLIGAGASVFFRAQPLLASSNAAAQTVL